MKVTIYIVVDTHKEQEALYITGFHQLAIEMEEVLKALRGDTVKIIEKEIEI